MAKIIIGHRVGENGIIRVGCSAVIFDKAREKILLTRRADNNQWCLPSGGGEGIRLAIDKRVFEVQCSIGSSEQELSTSVIKNPELGLSARVGTTLSGRKHITDFTDPARGTGTDTLYAETYKDTYKQ